jgi:pyruvate formate lyase activating enzyme
MSNAFGIKGFISTSLLDWPGKICSVIFLAGCGFRCPACHNSSLVLNPSSVPDYPLDRVLLSLSDRSKWIDGVTVTGGEPTARRDLPELLRLLRTCGVKVKLDTNGSNPGMLERLVRTRLIDAVSMDVKAPLTPQAYFRVAGVPVDVRTIRRSIRILRSSGLEIVFRTTAIPGLVEEPELDAIREALGDIPRFMVQSFRRTDTLSPAFALVAEFGRLRFDNMRAKFEVPTPIDLLPEPEATAAPDVRCGFA